MSARHDFVISITKDTVVAFEVVQENGQASVTEKIRVHWESDALAAAFDQVADALEITHVRCVVDDELAYTIGLFTVPEKITDESVQKSLQSHVPETLRRTYWDYSLVKNGETPAVQAYALTQQFSDEIRRAVDLSQVTLDVIEPVSQSLQRQVKEDSETCIVLHHDTNTKVGFLVLNGVVTSVIRFSEEVTSKNIQDYIDHLYEKYTLAETAIYCSGFSSSVVTALKQRVIPLVLHPAVGILKKTQLSGGSKKQLNVAVGLSKESKSLGGPTHNFENAWFEKKPKMIFVLIAIALVGLVSGLLFVWFLSRTNTSPELQDTEALVSSEGTGQPVIVSDYSIAVAQTVPDSELLKNELERLGLTVTLLAPEASDSASAQDSSATESATAPAVEIQTGSEVPQEVLDALDAALGNYSPTITSLTPGSGYDVLITVKQNSK